MSADTLIIGYGNPDRQDDGVGWHILKNLADKLGHHIPDDPGASIEVSDPKVDLLYILQIFPELAENISVYKRVCFVDAHTSDIPEEISWVDITPEYEKSPLTHHMSPRTVLSIANTIYDKKPEAILVSVRGYHFGFMRSLSPKTAKLAHDATQRIWAWIEHNLQSK
jgi:hydrogenase maturation protease